MRLRRSLCTSVLLVCVSASAQGDALAIVNANLLDGTGRPARLTSINVHGGEIVSIDQPPLPDARILDVDGATVLPGLIDSHVHLQSVPGAVFREDSVATRRTLMHSHLRAYLASGVTTVLDAAIAASALREIRAYLADGGVGRRVMALGPTFHNPGGYMDGDALSDYWSPRWRVSATPEDVDALYREYASIDDLVGVKVAATHGFRGPFDIYDTHTPEMLDVIRERAEAHGQRIYVHVNDDRGIDIALGLGARALTHLVPEGASDPLLRRLRDEGVYVITTLAVFDALSGRYERERLDAEHVRMTVPAVELDTGRDGAAWDGFLTTFVQLVNPWMPGWFAGWFGGWYFSEARVASELANMQSILKRHHAAGIPVVVGTDSGSWPHFLNVFHGPSTLREMELMVGAGMSTTETLRAATVTPAEMMGIEAVVGTVEVGKQADLIVVHGDPLEDLDVLGRPLWVVKGGDARSPAAWMD